MQPSEHKTVQARILKYAQEIGWSFVSRDEAERRRGGGGAIKNGELAVRNWSLFFDALLDAKVREFNPRYAEAEGALLGQFPPSPKGNGGRCRNFVEYPRDRDKFFEHEEKRERDLILEWEIEHG